MMALQLPPCSNWSQIGVSGRSELATRVTIGSEPTATALSFPVRNPGSLRIPRRLFSLQCQTWPLHAERIRVRQREQEYE